MGAEAAAIDAVAAAAADAAVVASVWHDGRAA